MCSYVRLLVKITTVKAITDMEEDVEGMRCEHKAACCVTGTPISLQLAGSFDTVADLYRLTKKNTVHVLCTLTEESQSGGLAIYKPIEIDTITDENMETILKTFKFEITRVKSHYTLSDAKSDGKPISIDQTPDLKRKPESPLSSPGWASPKRRLRVSTTDEATSAGIERAE